MKNQIAPLAPGAAVAVGIYILLLALRVFAVDWLERPVLGREAQLLVVLYGLLGASFAYALWKHLRYTSGQANPPLHRKTSYFLGISLGVIADYAVNDEHRWWEGPLKSDLYDWSFFICVAAVAVCLVKVWSSRKRNSESGERTEESAHWTTGSGSGNKGHEPSVQEDKEAKLHFQDKSSLGLDGEDKLNRRAYTEKVAEALYDRALGRIDNSLTVGLYGPWGSGKTSIFDMMENYLLKKPAKPIIFRFQPWYFGKDNNNIIPEFLKKLTYELEKTKNASLAGLIRDLKKYKKFMTPISLRPPGMIINLKEFTANPEYSKDYTDAEELRQQIVESLKGLKIPIFVLIDDLDRLDNKEIQMVFKLVRLIADFPKTTYIIAMDEEVVASSLAQLYSKDYKEEIGKSYIEKFIQVPLYLPAPDPVLLKELAWSMLEPIFAREKIKMNPFKVKGIFKEVHLTPRNIQRTANLLQVYLPMLKEEVDAFDLLRLMVIKAECPKLFDFIVKHSSYMLGQAKDEAARKAAADQLQANYSTYVTFVHELFPSITRMGGASPGWSIDKRICAAEHFWTYFMYSIPEGKISQLRINAFFEGLRSSMEAAEDVYKQLISKTSLSAANQKISDNIQKANRDVLLPLLGFMVNQFNRVYGIQAAASDEISLRAFIMDLLRDLLDGSETTEQVREEVYTILFNERKCWMLAVLAFKEDIGGMEFNRRCGIYLQSVFNYDDFIEHAHYDRQDIMNVWIQCAPIETVRKELALWVEEHGAASAVQHLITTDSFEEDDLLLSRYANIVKHIPVEIFRPRIQSLGKLNRPSTLNRIREGEEAAPLFLAYMDNHMYDYAVSNLKDILDNNRFPTPERQNVLQQLCEYGDSEKLEELKKLLSKYT